MSHLPFYQEQLQFMISLAESRKAFLDPFFYFLNYLDSPYFFFVLIPSLWIGFSYRWGIRIFYWMTFNNLLIVGFKNWISWNRPSTDLPSIAMLHPKSFGFPSGAAQCSIFLGGVLIYYGRFKAAKWIGLFYILLMSFSRLYLGVHYPLDILGGWGFGFLVLLFFILYQKKLEKWLKEIGQRYCLLLSIAVPLLICLLLPRTCYVMSSAIGIGIGTYISLKKKLFLPDSKQIKEGLVRAVMGVFLLGLCLFLLPGGKNPSTSFLAALFMSLLASPICQRLLKIKLR